MVYTKCILRWQQFQVAPDQVCSNQTALMYTTSGDGQEMWIVKNKETPCVVCKATVTIQSHIRLDIVGLYGSRQ